MYYSASSACLNRGDRSRSPATSADINGSTSAAMCGTDSITMEHLEAFLQMLQRAPLQDQAIRLPEVLSVVGISKSTWYARLNPRLPSYDPRVPKPFKLGTSDRSPSAWWRSEVMAYVRSCANAQPAL